MNSIIDYADLIDFLNNIDTKLVKTLVVDMCPCKVSKLFKYISEKYKFSIHPEKQLTKKDILEIHDLMQRAVIENNFEYTSPWGVIDKDAERIVELQNYNHVLELYNLPRHYFLHGKLEKSLRFVELCAELSTKTDKYILKVFDYASWYYPDLDLCDKLIKIVSENKDIKNNLSDIEQQNLINLGYEHLLNKHTSRALHNILKFCDLSNHSSKNILYYINADACGKFLSTM